VALRVHAVLPCIHAPPIVLLQLFLELLLLCGVSLTSHSTITPFSSLLACYTENFDIRKECVWAISNATSGGDDVQINSWSTPAACPLGQRVGQPDVRLVSVALEGIKNILKCGETRWEGWSSRTVWVGSGSLLCGLSTQHLSEAHPISLGESKAISVYSLELGQNTKQ
jgi:hypothetical protein